MLYQNPPHLLDLVRFRERALGLQVEDLEYPCVREDVVATFDSLGKAESQQEFPQFGKTNAAIRSSTQYSEQG